ncbi:hypothetical protein B0H11DRAFT_2193481 [Mycena galericulata]|nr:hypothetical protein B0H11DRAFT_2193481 [Mycena galericulata]
MFETAADIPTGEIKAYRKFAFPAALGNATHDPFFSVENAASWITSHGYQLYLEYNDSETTTSWSPDDASAKQLKGYRSHMISEEYVDHPFFSLENTDTWINLIPFQAYMALRQAQYRSGDTTSFSSRAPSRVASSASLAGSRASSRVSFRSSSRASSPVSFLSSDVPSRPPSSMSMADVGIDRSDDEFPENPPIPLTDTNTDAHNQLPSVEPQCTVATVPGIVRPGSPALASNYRPKKQKGKAKSKAPQIKITRQLKVDELEDTTVQSTWTVPRTLKAFRVDLSGMKHLLTDKTGKVLALDTFIRSEDQESWRGSTGHIKGDTMVFNLAAEPDKAILCRRAQFYCNGVDACEFIDPDLFSGCERDEPDMDAMRDLWNHELDANESEAASVSGIMSRPPDFTLGLSGQNVKSNVRVFRLLSFAQRSVALSKYPAECSAQILRDSPNTESVFFVGCSKWSREQRWDHVYWEIPSNINENVLEHVMQNDGHLPAGTANVNEQCVLTVHPRIGLRDCPYSHVINGQIRPAKIRSRRCPTEMVIFIPVDEEYSTKAIVILRNPHNHPAHPHTKPSAEDKNKLEAAVQAAGLTGLTVQRLLNAPSTAMVYDGGRVAESSPAFADSRKVRDFISDQKKKEHPYGMGWNGVLHELNSREILLPKSEHYIHTAVHKNGFRLIVTMHPYIAMFIHNILALIIDYTFKRVEGDLDEWEVAGFVDRVKHCDWSTPVISRAKRGKRDLRDLRMWMQVRSIRKKTGGSPVGCSRNTTARKDGGQMGIEDSGGNHMTPDGAGQVPEGVQSDSADAGSNRRKAGGSGQAPLEPNTM